MLISLKEISKYVDISDLTPEIIASKLTSAGIEVEGINYLSNATNLVIGHILKCENHPNSDHLHVAQVNIGSEIVQIVCGAPNCREGLNVIVARPGACLPGDKKIEKGVLRGIESDGMLCALNEIGVDPKNLKPEQISGIEELPKDAPIGETNVLKYLGLDDVILDLSLLANRSDCYAIYNVAREIAALFNKKVEIPSYISSNLVDIKYKTSSNTSNCKQFAIRNFENVITKESSSELAQFVRNEGIRSIDNIVDIGNCTMLLTGQPINMYDADKLPAKELIVRDDYEGDVVAMDGKTYTIKKGDLVVTSGGEVMCIAGIMTSKCCEVTKDTKNVLVEVANFYGPQIRKTSIRLGLSSDSSQRFIKGINPNQVEDVMELVTFLMNKYSSYSSVSKTNNYIGLEYKTKEIKCSYNYINTRLGTNFDKSTIIRTLNKLYIKTKELSDDDFVATIPDFRIDIEGKADLSEEIIRYNGFENIDSSLPKMETTVGRMVSFGKQEKIIADYLLNRGLDRIISYTLINKEDSETFNFINKNEKLEVLHPLTEDHKYIRTNLMSSMIRTAQYNFNHQNKNFALFEISQINDKKSLTNHLCICLCGKKFTQDKLNAIPYDFFDMKGYFETILKMFNIQNTRISYERLSDSCELHPNRSALIKLDNKLFAVIGEMHPGIKNKYDLNKEDVVLLEMDLDILFKTKSANNLFSEFNKYPSVTRDYAFVVDSSLSYQTIKNQIKRASSLVKDVSLFDIYKGEHLESNKVSLALSIVIDGKDHTLKEDEINEVDKKIRDVIKEKLNGSIRS